ncbi:hypothetical protein BKA65DRAFT_543288 [Rhexocercosporidium sp. MPI-PUGE-AT-0058]|nr:hypothetical protein BKA65DRAFT_543288 [Rhexocercosporidium sp. MPI-PUGE-AT-0058]
MNKKKQFKDQRKTQQRRRRQSANQNQNNNKNDDISTYPKQTTSLLLPLPVSSDQLRNQKHPRGRTVSDSTDSSASTTVASPPASLSASTSPPCTSGTCDGDKATLLHFRRLNLPSYTSADGKEFPDTSLDAHAYVQGLRRNKIASPTLDITAGLESIRLDPDICWERQMMDIKDYRWNLSQAEWSESSDQEISEELVYGGIVYHDYVNESKEGWQGEVFRGDVICALAVIGQQMLDSKERHADISREYLARIVSVTSTRLRVLEVSYDLSKDCVECTVLKACNLSWEVVQVERIQTDSICVAKCSSNNKSGSLKPIEKRKRAPAPEPEPERVCDHRVEGIEV